MGALEVLPLDRAVDDAAAMDDDGNEGEQDYDYLLNTSLVSFTKEVADRLQHEHATKQVRLHELQTTTPTQMWRKELDRLRALLLRETAFQGSAVSGSDAS